ncbi:MAG: uracil-DNA glycosylase [Parachlamydiales bacterium]
MQSLSKRVKLGAGWHEVLDAELDEPYMEELAEFVRQERSRGPVYPPPEQVFRAFQETPYERVKIVIVGQDPYHGPGQAEGLSFSVPKGVRPPPSLQNIFREIERDLGIPRPAHGHLAPWAHQGVLLLNSILTVREGQPQSHQGRGWERFTDFVIGKLAARPVVFFLWGRFAREKVQRVIPPGTPAHVLIAPHPSPLSAHAGFIGCGHFSEGNRLLEAMGHPPIDWRLP